MGTHLSENTLNYLSTYSTPRHTQLLKEDKAWTSSLKRKEITALGFHCEHCTQIRQEFSRDWCKD